MIFVDSHCHLDRLRLGDEYQDIGQLITDTQKSGVEYLLNVCIDKQNWQIVTDIANENQNVFCAVGVHPDSPDTANITYDELAKIASHPKAIAIGETGLDYFHQTIPKKQQIDSLRTHIRVALDQNMPLVIHSRQAKDDTIKILQQENAAQVRGIMHCFTEDLAMAKLALDLGFYISFSGILTFKNAQQLQSVAKALPLDRILIETDSPFLAPAPFRGKPNQPKYVKYVAEKLAEIKNCDIETIAQQTTNNFLELFAL